MSMTNAELRSAIKDVSDHILLLCRQLRPDSIDQETAPHRKHLETLLSIEAQRASKIEETP